MPKVGYCENEDLRPPTKTKTNYENEDSPTKTKTNYENEDSPTKTKTPLRKRRQITKTKTPHENEDPSRKRRHISETSSKEVGITFEDKDYVHETHYENKDPYGKKSCILNLARL